ncbi:MAG: metallophosphoesterase, partial [Bacteroidaceae bacterium]|nr:metallophosphoesterase [Bacteroidaceae bacterium]
INARIDKLEEEVLPNVKIGFYLNSSGQEVENANYGISDFIPVTSNTQYIFNAEQPVGRLGKIIIYSSNKTTLRTYYSEYGEPYAITTPSDSAYIRMSVGLGDKIPYLNQGGTNIWERYLDTRKQCNSNSKRIDVLEDYNNTYSNLGVTIETAIKEYRNRVCRNSKKFALNFGFLTDVHLTSSGAVEHLKRLYTMAKYGKSSAAKFLLFGGDLVSGENTVALDMTTMLNGKEAFKDNFALDCLMVRGNHDGSHKAWKAIVDGGGHPTYDDEINNQDWYNMMVSSLDGIVIDQANPMGGYFYKDYPIEKIRVIVLNCYDMTGTNPDGNAYNAMYSKASIRQAQATWLSTKALDFSDKGDDKSNWGIVVTSHDGVDADNSAFGDGNKVELMLQAFKKGERYEWTYSFDNDPNYYVSIVADFRTQGPMKYYAFIHGHTHTDRVIFQDGVPHISSGAAHPDDTEDMPAGATLPLPRTVGTVSEYLWDTASVADDMVSMFRFGAVESEKTSGDRYIHLGTNEVAVDGTITLTPTKVSGTLTWGIYSVSTGYYVPIVNGVAGTPVGTPTNHASISNGVVTGLSVGYATAFAQDEAGNKEFFGINIVE